MFSNINSDCSQTTSSDEEEEKSDLNSDVLNTEREVLIDDKYQLDLAKYDITTVEFVKELV